MKLRVGCLAFFVAWLLSLMLVFNLTLLFAHSRAQHNHAEPNDAARQPQAHKATIKGHEYRVLPVLEPTRTVPTATAAVTAPWWDPASDAPVDDMLAKTEKPCDLTMLRRPEYLLDSGLGLFQPQPDSRISWDPQACDVIPIPRLQFPDHIWMVFAGDSLLRNEFLDLVDTLGINRRGVNLGRLAGAPHTVCCSKVKGGVNGSATFAPIDNSNCRWSKAGNVAQKWNVSSFSPFVEYQHLHEGRGVCLTSHDCQLVSNVRDNVLVPLLDSARSRGHGTRPTRDARDRVGNTSLHLPHAYIINSGVSHVGSGGGAQWTHRASFAHELSQLVGTMNDIKRYMREVNDINGARFLYHLVPSTNWTGSYLAPKDHFIAAFNRQVQTLWKGLLEEPTILTFLDIDLLFRFGFYQHMAHLGNSDDVHPSHECGLYQLAATLDLNLITRRLPFIIAGDISYLHNTSSAVEQHAPLPIEAPVCRPKPVLSFPDNQPEIPKLPPPDGFELVVAERYSGCDKACAAAGLVCLAQLLPYINNCEALAKAFPGKCPAARCSFQAFGHDLPGYRITDSVCLLNNRPWDFGFACHDHWHPDVIRLCPCAPDPEINQG